MRATCQSLKGRVRISSRGFQPAWNSRLSLSKRALGASRELGEEEDGYITEDGEGLRIWVGDDAFELELEEHP